MPDHYPDYPNHLQLQAYFESYARHFHVIEHIFFKHNVTSVTRAANDKRFVAFTDEAGKSHIRIFDYLMVCNGHHWNPKFPEYPESLLAHLCTHTILKASSFCVGAVKAALVIGAGNSACDIAVEAARLANKVCLSMRSPQWFVPKFIFGMPSDVFAARTNWMPAKFKQFSLTRLLKLLQGPYSRYGLPTNTLPALSQHPTLNSDLLDFIRHSRITPRPAIEQFIGDNVEFANGEVEAFDIVCACTGFWITFPFFKNP